MVAQARRRRGRGRRARARRARRRGRRPPQEGAREAQAAAAAALATGGGGFAGAAAKRGGGGGGGGGGAAAAAAGGVELGAPGAPLFPGAPSLVRNSVATKTCMLVLGGSLLDEFEAEARRSVYAPACLRVLDFAPAELETDETDEADEQLQQMLRRAAGGDAAAAAATGQSVDGVDPALLGKKENHAAAGACSRSNMGVTNKLLQFKSKTIRHVRRPHTPEETKSQLQIRRLAQLSIQRDGHAPHEYRRMKALLVSARDAHTESAVERRRLKNAEARARPRARAARAAPRPPRPARPTAPRGAGSRAGARRCPRSGRPSGGRAPDDDHERGEDALHAGAARRDPARRRDDDGRRDRAPRADRRRERGRGARGDRGRPGTAAAASRPGTAAAAGLAVVQSPHRSPAMRPGAGSLMCLTTGGGSRPVGRARERVDFLSARFCRRAPPALGDVCQSGGPPCEIPVRRSAR